MEADPVLVRGLYRPAQRGAYETRVLPHRVQMQALDGVEGTAPVLMDPELGRIHRTAQDQSGAAFRSGDPPRATDGVVVEAQHVVTERPEQDRVSCRAHRRRFATVPEQSKGDRPRGQAPPSAQAPRQLPPRLPVHVDDRAWPLGGGEGRRTTPGAVVDDAERLDLGATFEPAVTAGNDAAEFVRSVPCRNRHP